MLFKQAAGTGWDCPRAHVLVMYREINSASFYHSNYWAYIKNSLNQIAKKNTKIVQFAYELDIYLQIIDEMK
jgi:hypothetical protein